MQRQANSAGMDLDVFVYQPPEGIGNFVDDFESANDFIELYGKLMVYKQNTLSCFQLFK